MTPEPVPDRAEHTVVELAAGQLLSLRYRLVREIGRGGMGIVWLAEDTRLDNQPVAIKVLPAFLCRDERAVARLKEEAKRSLTLSHPGIVRLYTFDRDPLRGNVAFLVMEYIEGQTLNALLADHPSGLPLERVLPWAEQIASALDYAHGRADGSDRSLLHRDIKPGNIIIDTKGRAHLLDFGIAREMKDTYTRVTGLASSGTLVYMSPQQLDGKDDPSNDIYSLAVTIYEALSGDPPFRTGEIAHQIRHLPPPPLTNVPVHVSAALMAGLAKTKEERPKSAGDMADRLRIPPSHAISTDHVSSSLRPPMNPLTHGGPFPWKALFTVLVCFAVLIPLIGLSIRNSGGWLPENKRRNQVSPTSTADLIPPAPGQRWTNSIGMEFVQIPAGEFLMGSPANETNRDNDETQHRVTLTKGYWLGVTEVTQGQWKAVMVNNPSHFIADDSLPVDVVFWDDAVEFCRRLSQKDGNSYRLPTEAEWEYACRAGTTGSYAGDLDQMAWYGEKSDCTMHPVRTKSANAWGLYDMHGNVWEWCSDWYGAYAPGPDSDPMGPKAGESRVLRSGSCASIPKLCRSANRLMGSQVSRLGNVGFRVALDSE